MLLGGNTRAPPLNWSSLGLPNDPYVLERGLRNFKRKLSMDESQPLSLREAMQRQLKEPLKHQQVEVIEVEAVVGDGKS